jgi:WD40 repeat protein/serine/threonine protein kinase
MIDRADDRQKRVTEAAATLPFIPQAAGLLGDAPKTSWAPEPVADASSAPTLSVDAADSFDGDIDRIADEFEAAWQKAPRPPIPIYLAKVPPAVRPSLLNELIEVDWEYRLKGVGTPHADHYPLEMPELLGDRGEFAARWPEIRSRLLARADGGPAKVETTPSKSSDDPSSSEFPQIEGYRILGVLGKGGMGEVFKALQLGTRREVAIKFMRGSFASDKARARFDREVELTARLDHPCIARIFDSGLHHGVYYYAMELIDGLPLDQSINQRKLDRAEVLELFAEICRAVAHAHQRGVIHRDLKPSNIMVSADGRPHVLDFGLAKALTDAGASAGWHAPADQNLSIEGDLAGTPAFMSPEQAGGHVASLDTRTDVYSLGVILYRLLCGRLPHDTAGGVLQVLRRICDDEPVRPRDCRKDIGSELESLMLKALAKEPDDRYASASDLARDIENYLHGEPLTVRAPSTLYFLRKRLWKHRWPVSAGVAVIMALAVMLVVSYVRISRARTRALNAEAVAKRETRQKETARRHSEVERADDLISKADILGAAGKWDEAKTSYATAAKIFAAEGTSPIRATIGQWNANRVAPQPLNVFAGSVYFGDAAPRSLAISSDGRLAVTGSLDGIVRLWDTATGQLLHTLPNDGQHAVDGGEDGNATVWNVATGATEHVLHAPGGWVTHVAISSDGQTVLTASGETEATLVADRNDTLCLCHPDGTMTSFNAIGRINGAIFSPDGKSVLTFGQQMALWDARNGRSLHDFAGRERIISAAFSPDGHSILTGGADGAIQIWDADSGIERKSFAGRGGAIAAVGYAAGPDPLIVFAADDRTVHLVSTVTDQEIRTFIGNARATGDPAAVPSAAFSTDGRFCLYCAADGKLILWNLGQTPEENAFQTDGPVTDIAPLAGGRIVLARDSSGPSLWDLSTHRKLQPAGWSPGKADGCAASPDGRWLATVRGQRLTLWDSRKLTAPRTLTVKRKPNQPAPLVFSPDGRLLLVPIVDNAVDVIDADAAQELAQLSGHKGTVTSLAISSDGRVALTGSRDKTARLWDIADPKSPRPLSVLPGHADAINAVAFSPNGKWAATAGGNSDYEAGQDDFAIRLWSVVPGNIAAPGHIAAPAAPIHSLTGHARRVRALAFSSDGLILASGDDAGSIKLWDPRTGEELRTLIGGTGATLSLAFLPGTNTLFSGGEDHFIRKRELNAPLERAILSTAFAAAALKMRAGDPSKPPTDPAALAACGRWYAWAGLDAWAAEFFTGAAGSLTPKDQFSLAGCCWSLGCLDQAEAAFRSSSGLFENWYLQWYLDTIAPKKPKPENP